MYRLFSIWFIVFNKTDSCIRVDIFKMTKLKYNEFFVGFVSVLMELILTFFVNLILNNNCFNKCLANK